MQRAARATSSWWAGRLELLGCCPHVHARCMPLSRSIGTLWPGGGVCVCGMSGMLWDVCISGCVCLCVLCYGCGINQPCEAVQGSVRYLTSTQGPLPTANKHAASCQCVGFLSRCQPGCSNSGCMCLRCLTILTAPKWAAACMGCQLTVTGDCILWTRVGDCIFSLHCIAFRRRGLSVAVPLCDGPAIRHPPSHPVV